MTERTVDPSERRKNGLSRQDHIFQKFILERVKTHDALAGILLFQTTDSPQWRGHASILVKSGNSLCPLDLDHFINSENDESDGDEVVKIQSKKSNHKGQQG